MQYTQDFLRTRIRPTALCVVAALASGCGSGIHAPATSSGSAIAAAAGPQLGYFWNQADQTLRPVLGIPGASQIGASVVAAGLYTTGAGSASSQLALLQESDGSLDVMSLPSGQPSHLSAQTAPGAQIRFSPLGQSAVLFKPGNAGVLLVTGFEHEPSRFDSNCNCIAGRRRGERHRNACPGQRRHERESGPDQRRLWIVAASRNGWSARRHFVFRYGPRLRRLVRQHTLDPPSGDLILSLEHRADRRAVSQTHSFGCGCRGAMGFGHQLRELQPSAHRLDRAKCSAAYRLRLHANVGGRALRQRHLPRHRSGQRPNLGGRSGRCHAKVLLHPRTPGAKAMRPLLRVLCALLPMFVPAAFAQGPDSLYYTAQGSIAANSNGAAVQIYGYYPTTPTAVCFYTGFGSTGAADGLPGFPTLGGWGRNV